MLWTGTCTDEGAHLALEEVHIEELVAVHAPELEQAARRKMELGETLETKPNLWKFLSGGGGGLSVSAKNVKGGAREIRDGQAQG